MTGPDHYLEAQRLLALLEDWKTEISATGNSLPVALADTIDRAAEMTLATAQVHATLAVAAATAMNGYAEDGMYAADFKAWDKVCGVDGQDQT